MAKLPESEIMIDVIKASKTYPPNVEALAGVSLTINRGELVFLTGKSGAGKTTLLRLISRIENPTRGLIEVAGQDLAKLSRRKLQKLRRSIGFAFQDFKLLPNRTVAQNIAISMEVIYTPGRTIRRRVKDLLRMLDLEDKYSTPASELSRGEQQRVTIARAVAAKPDIILADEPTGNLDAETTGLVMDLFRKCKEEGATLLVATHDAGIYQNSEHRVVTLHRGRWRTDDDPPSVENQNESSEQAL